MARITVDEAGSAAILALIDTFAHSEIGDALLLASDDGYNVLVGATPQKPLTFGDYSKHPHTLNTQLNSTAAGRYQFIYRTWESVARILGLDDFSPENQDRACIELVRERGGLPYLARGDIAGAIDACREEWASLPGAGYGQHENAMSNLTAYYATALTRYSDDNPA